MFNSFKCSSIFISSWCYNWLWMMRIFCLVIFTLYKFLIFISQKKLLPLCVVEFVIENRVFTNSLLTTWTLFCADRRLIRYNCWIKIIHVTRSALTCLFWCDAFKLFIFVIYSFFSEVLVVHQQINYNRQNVPQIKWIEVNHCGNIECFLRVIVNI